jgi:endonuclease G
MNMKKNISQVSFVWMFVVSLLFVVSCGEKPSTVPPETTVALSVSPLSLTYNETSSSSNTVTVTTNSAWTASGGSSALKFSPASGNGSTIIDITDAPKGESVTLTVKAGSGDGAKQASVTITRQAESGGGDDDGGEDDGGGDDDEGETAETVFSLDFGTVTTGWANQSNEWKTQTGTGASTVSYEAYNVGLRGDNYGSAGKYTGASGKGYARMFDNAATDYFSIQNITLPAGEVDYTLTFGTSFTSSDVSLTISADGVIYKPIDYTGASTYNTWAQGSAGFTLSEPASKLYIRLAPTGVDRTYGMNFDDIILTTGGGGQEVDFTSAKNLRWAELPSNFESHSADYFTHTHWATTVSSGKFVRNYSYCYDTKRHGPVWVAYPQHLIYKEGNGRSNTWAADPALDPSLQAKIWGNNNRNYTTYTIDANGLSGSSWSRGHLLMSGERGGEGFEINEQTFYSTNIAPQVGENADSPSTFGKIWGNFEAIFNDITKIPADTLYVVVGCYRGDDNLIEWDATWDGMLSADSKECVMPTYQFKMGVRKKTPQVGKPIQECTADEVETLAFWLDTFTTSTSTSASQVSEFIVPISFIEEKMGIEFFPWLDDSVKDKKGTLSAWR